MRRVATSVAVMGFFTLAIVGSVSGVEPYTCALRALAGAAILFVLVRVTGRMAAGFLVDAMLDRVARLNQVKDRTREHGN